MSEEINLESQLGDVVAEAVNGNTDNNEATPVVNQESVSDGKEASVEQEAPAAENSFAADDAVIERAVKAGLSVADAKAFSSAEQADRILSALEAKTTPTSKDSPEDIDGEDSPAEDAYGDALKEMESDGEYDPNILKLLKGMHEELVALKKAGASAQKQEFFDKQFGALDENVRNHVDAAKKSKLKSKFDVLERGYKTANANVSREDIFKEAVQLALGDLVGKAAEESKASALVQRKNLTLARPSGEIGQKYTGSRPVTEDDIASVLWEQLTN